MNPSNLIEQMKKPTALGLSAGLLALIVLGAVFSGIASVVLIVIAYFLGNAAGAKGAPDLFGARPPVITRATPDKSTAIKRQSDV